MQKIGRAGVTAVLVGLALTGCVGLPMLPNASPIATETETPKPSATPNPTPTATKTPFSLVQLRSLIGSVTAKDGIKAQVMDDAAVAALQNQRAFLSPGIVTEPAECLSLLRSGTLSDYRIPTALGIVGPPGAASTIQVSYDDSGLYYDGINNLGYSIAHCSPISIVSGEERVGYSLNYIPADLHGNDTISVVVTLTAPDGSQLHILRCVVKDGNVFVTGETPIPEPYPTDETRAELVSYVNTVIDNAAQLEKGLSTTDPTKISA